MFMPIKYVDFVLYFPFFSTFSFSFTMLVLHVSGLKRYLQPWCERRVGSQTGNLLSTLLKCLLSLKPVLLLMSSRAIHLNVSRAFREPGCYSSLVNLSLMDST